MQTSSVIYGIRQETSYVSPATEVVVSGSPEDPGERAALKQHKKQQAQEAGAKAMSDYEAANQATREKTARLRAMRLAQEASDREKAVPPPATKKVSGAKKKSSKSAQKEPLSDWLKAQRGEGRRS